MESLKNYVILLKVYNKYIIIDLIVVNSEVKLTEMTMVTSSAVWLLLFQCDEAIVVVVGFGCLFGHTGQWGDNGDTTSDR